MRTLLQRAALLAHPPLPVRVGCYRRCAAGAQATARKMDAPRRIVFCTGNAKKLKEVREILGTQHADKFTLDSMSVDLPELQARSTCSTATAGCARYAFNTRKDFEYYLYLFHVFLSAAYCAILRSSGPTGKEVGKGIVGPLRMGSLAPGRAGGYRQRESAPRRATDGVSIQHTMTTRAIHSFTAAA